MQFRMSGSAARRLRNRVIAAADDRFFPLSFQRRIAQERLNAVLDVVPGGHLVALSRPKELADLLLSMQPA